MSEKIDYKILQKFTEGKYSLKDYQQISGWFGNEQNEPELKDVIQQHWTEFSDFTGEKKDLNNVLHLLKEKIDHDKPSTNFQTKFRSFYMRAAAILLLPLVLYSVYSTLNGRTTENTNASIEIVSPHGARTKFQLPDGTNGWLNSGSSLKYNTNFQSKRNIELVGEAWLEVAHNPEKPFTVHTSNLDVQVLGTKFDITAFPDENEVSVVLLEGKVKVNGYKGLYSVNVKPGQKFTYNNSLQSGDLQEVNTTQYSAWKDGLLVFRNEPLSEVLKRVSRWYNVEINLDDPELKSLRYRATFHEEQVEEVIRLISLTIPIEYTFNDREVGSDGIFKKRTINIRKKNS